MAARSWRTFETGAFGVAVVLLAGVAYSSDRSTATMVEAAGRIQHTHRVLEALDALLVATVDAETGRRGFALTNDEAMLQPYRNSAARAATHLAEVRALTADNPDQQRRVDALEPRVRARLKALEDTIAAQRATGFEHFREARETLAGREKMDEIRVDIATLAATERELLAAREQRTKESVRASRKLQLVTAVLAVGLLVLVVLRLRRAIRQREESEERTRENEQDLAITLSSIGDGVIATDAEGHVTRMNPVAESVTGWTLAEARGKPIEDVFRLVDDRTTKDAPSPVARALREREIVEIDDGALLVAKDGTKRRVADSAAPIRASDGDVRGAVLVFHDITKTLDDARSLRRAHAFLDSIVENMPDMIFVKDARNLAFVRFNRAGEALLGLKREDLIGKSDFDFFPPEQAKAFIEKDRETLRGKEVVDIAEEPIETAQGPRWLHTKKVPIVDEAGEPEYLLGISADITEQRRADVLLRESMNATEVAHRELEAFSYSVAHDLRSPLRSIDGFSQALLDDYGDVLDAEGKDYLSRVRNSARRMAELIDDLLALARVSRTELARSTVDISALARDVGEQARKTLNAQAALVVADGLSASCDARLVRVLFENLLANAFKFSSRVGAAARIEVGANVDGGTRAFFVRDNGAGFDLAAAAKLFTAFQRYHRPTEFEGTGIGLATAARIVARHGGRIWADSAPNAGATFHFILERGDKTK